MGQPSYDDSATVCKIARNTRPRSHPIARPLALHVPEVDFCVMELIDPEFRLGCTVTASTRPMRNMGVQIAKEQLPSTHAYGYSMLMHGRIAGVLVKKSDWGNDDSLTKYRPTVLHVA